MIDVLLRLTDGLWELVASIGLSERTWVGDSDELLLLISDSAVRLVVLDAAISDVQNRPTRSAVAYLTLNSAR